MIMTTNMATRVHRAVLVYRPFVTDIIGLRKMSSMQNKEPVLVQTDRIGNVFLIGINRPGQRNCVNQATADALINAFNKFERDSDLHTAVLYGKGGCFCAGYDLEALSKLDPAEAEAQDTSHFMPTTKAIPECDKRAMGPSKMSFSKPVIAAIQGYAVAGGLELACLCDLRVMEESAVMGVFCRRFGVPLIDGGTVRLPKLIGLSRAMDLILTGRPVHGQEAFDMGLANRLVKDGTAVGEAVKLAQYIQRFPQKCMKTDRQSAYFSTYNARSQNEAHDYEFEHGIKIVAEESVKGAKKFVKGAGRHGKTIVEKGKKKGIKVSKL